jgi:hypothetical protein
MAMHAGARVALAAAGVVVMVSGVCRIEKLNMIESVGGMFHNGRWYMGILSSLRNFLRSPGLLRLSTVECRVLAFR